MIEESNTHKPTTITALQKQKFFTITDIFRKTLDKVNLWHLIKYHCIGVIKKGVGKHKHYRGPAILSQQQIQSCGEKNHKYN